MLGGAVDDDDEAARAIDVQRLPVDPASLERAVVARPPLIAVTRACAWPKLGAGRVSEPVVGNDWLTIDASAVKDELTEAAVKGR